MEAGEVPEAITGAGAVGTDGGCGWVWIKLEELYGVDILQLHNCQPRPRVPDVLRDEACVMLLLHDTCYRAVHGPG